MDKIISALVVLFLYVPATMAGVSDSPIPTFSDGNPSKWIYTVTGIAANKNGASPQLQTSITCTNLEKTKAINIGVEFFNFNGVLLNTIASGDGEILGVPPGATRTFSTENTAAFFDDESGFIGSAVIDQGSARIVSTSTKLVCTAAVLDDSANPPASMNDLNIIKKTTQKGD